MSLSKGDLPVDSKIVLPLQRGGYRWGGVLVRMKIFEIKEGMRLHNLPVSPPFFVVARFIERF
jgi:hypothetical protein